MAITHSLVLLTKVSDESESDMGQRVMRDKILFRWSLLQNSVTFRQGQSNALMRAHKFISVLMMN
jgi:hypothetical protein